MRKCEGVSRWVLGVLLLLGACVNTADVPTGAVLQAPSAASVPESATPPPAEPAAGDVPALETGGELAALDPSAGLGEPDGLTPIASTVAKNSVDENITDP